MGFNAFTGFMLSATEFMEEYGDVLAEQSFNAFTGFMLSATVTYTDGVWKCDPHPVSMPSQALCFLRPEEDYEAALAYAGFNAFTGFMLSATSTLLWAIWLKKKFQCLHRLYAFCDREEHEAIDPWEGAGFNAFTGFMLSATVSCP